MLGGQIFIYHFLIALVRNKVLVFGMTETDLSTTTEFVCTNKEFVFGFPS